MSKQKGKSSEPRRATTVVGRSFLDFIRYDEAKEVCKSFGPIELGNAEMKGPAAKRKVSECFWARKLGSF